jgi:hypothetical protein
MAAKCAECGECVSLEPYPDERMLAGTCAVCEMAYLCEDCLMRVGGICTACKRVIEAP